MMKTVNELMKLIGQRLSHPYSIKNFYTLSTVSDKLFPPSLRVFNTFVSTYRNSAL
jgi:hypothetical protein